MSDDASMTDELDSLDRDDDVLAGSNKLVEFAPGIVGQQQAGWLITIETTDGLVQIDTGDQAASSLAAIRQRFDQSFAAVIYSHGHQRYNQACREWISTCVRETGRVPRIIAHQNLPRRQRRYLESNGLQNRLLERQFRYPEGSLEGRVFPFTQPTETFSDKLTISSSDRTIDVTWAPSETDDAVAVWLREDKILYGGPSCIPFFPNVGSPQRPVRDPVRWADTLDRLGTYPAEMLIGEFGDPLEGPEAIAEYLTSTAAALRWCHDIVVSLMNKGHTVAEIVNMVEPDPEIFDRPWLQEGYTSIEHVLRDVYRGQFGWWEDLNPTSLHPAHPNDVAREIRSAISDPSKVLDHAKSLAERGELKLALHVIDLLALDPESSPETDEAKVIKADLCRRAANELTRSYVTQSLYLNGADQLDPSGDDS